MSEIPPVAELLAARAGEELALNDRHLNRQLGRVVRTLGLDRSWRRGEGAELIDEHGERFLDLVAGHGVFAVGRNHPEVAAAIEATLAARTASLPQLGVGLLSGVLAEQLLARAPARLEAMVPANSGAEAVEAAIKLARAATGRSRLLHAGHSFHGLTIGALSLNGNEEFRRGFEPLLPGCEAVPFGDLEALGRALAAGDVAAFVVEPIQGKGVNLPPPGYLEGAQRLCREAGALFVCDEVQTGLGRTGRFLALERWNLEPDLVCLAKALSGGMVPAAAVLATRAAMDAVYDRMESAARHSSTFAGNDLAAAAGLATLRIMERERLVERARRGGELLMELTAPLAERYEVVREVRGMGLMWAIELGPPSGGAARRAWLSAERLQPGICAQLVTVPLFHRHRVFVQVAGHGMDVIKALPPLVVSDEQLHRFAAALDDVLAGAERTPSALARLAWRIARRRRGEGSGPR